MHITDIATNVFHYLSVFPLPIITLILAFGEDLIAPIPSPVVLGAVGLLARTEIQNPISIYLIIIIAAAGKTLSAIFFYTLADRFEDRLPRSFYKKFGVSHEKIEQFGEKISRGRWDDITLFVMRAIPSFPSATVSVAAGFFKTNYKTYVLATFLGYLIPSALYILAGYHGVELVDEAKEIIELIKGF